MNPILDALIQQANSETSQETSSNQSHPQSQQQDSVKPRIFDYLLEQVNADAVTHEKPLTIGQMILQGSLEDEDQSK